MYLKRASKLSIVAGALFLASVILPTAAHAANTCNAFIAINYSSTQTYHDVGDTLMVTLTVGAGTIRGGTKATINRVRFEMDCDAGSPLGIGCLDDGAIIKYLGDQTIVTDCPRAFSTGHGANTAPNQLVFTPATPFDILASNPSFCSITFGIAVMALSDDITPGKAEEVTGYSAANADVQCDNGLSSGGSQSGSILLCPACDDSNQCTQDTCNRDTGVCSNTNVVFCDDNNACTTDRCVPETGLCENKDNVTPTCNDNNLCTTDSCNPVTGACVNTDTKTPTCNDNNACTTDRCVPATGQCENIDTKTPTCNDNNACTRDTCDPATGTCVNTDVVTPTCDDHNACTRDTCDQATGRCVNTDTVTPTCDDHNLCTQDRCDPTTGQCTNMDAVRCGNPTCETCDPAIGQCQFDPNRDPSCGPGPCRMTGGGQVALDPPFQGSTKATYGGEVGAPCGCRGCFDTINGNDKNDHVQGNWTHQRHKRGGMFKAQEFNSLVCACDGVFDGKFCNRGDREPGPEPRKAPANKICFSGVGNFDGKTAAFRVEVEDRGEPARGKNAGTLEDVYRIRIWVPTGTETAKGLAASACCTIATPVIRAPDVNDGGNVLGGNLQIHPPTPNSERGKCPTSGKGLCPGVQSNLRALGLTGSGPAKRKASRHRRRLGSLEVSS